MHQAHPCHSVEMGLVTMGQAPSCPHMTSRYTWLVDGWGLVYKSNPREGVCSGCDPREGVCSGCDLREGVRSRRGLTAVSACGMQLWSGR